MKEENYIRYRKLKAWGNRLCFYLCRVFPIQNNLICVCTFEGKGGFGCNPKYIVEELHKKNPNLKFVWLVNRDIYEQKKFPEYIKKVPNSLWSRSYWLSKSRVWIDNYRKPYGTVKRKEQYYLNTWHGTVGFKSIGLWRGQAFSKMAYLVSKSDSDMIDDIIIDSKWCEEVFHKGLLYDKPFTKTGYPRCDILYGKREKQKEKFKREKKISLDSKLLIYAPTYREKRKNGVRFIDTDLWTIDFKRVIEELEKVFGGKWNVVVRLHPQLATKINSQSAMSSSGMPKFIDASKDDDMYEILAAGDALITDYSSVAMEAGFMKIPVFLYADDLEDYMKNRGGEQWMFNADSSLPIYNNREMMPNLSLELPFSLAQNNSELLHNILTYDEDAYLNKIEKFKENLQLVFDGKASERVAELIMEKINQ